MTEYTTSILEALNTRYPEQSEFLQAVEEVFESISELLEDNPQFEKHAVLERLTEPDRVYQFRVTWQDDKNNVNVNRGYRIQFNNALGPYKGGLRFHPSVNLSILKFLGFEQIFKNALTGIPMGGGKGGSDFDPANKSDSEIMRFCQAFIAELAHHIGDRIDIPAGDIGVGGKEIGYMFGYYKKLKHEFSGVLTGKGVDWGGSYIRPEATGYGLLYFVENMLEAKKDKLENKVVLISGSGNVAQYAAEKALEMSAKVVSMSDSGGHIYVPDGITNTQLEWIKDLKEVRAGRIKEFADKFGCDYYEDEQPWLRHKADIALPCATQNEIDKREAMAMIENGIRLVAEGANMPCTIQAVAEFSKNNVNFAPGKATNAGGVAVSGLEMSQNSTHSQWERKLVDKQLKDIMSRIHNQCVLLGSNKGNVNYLKGANRYSFLKVANALLAQGIV